MKSKSLMNAIGGIEDKYIEEAEPVQKPEYESAKPPVYLWRKVLPIAACLVLVVAVTMVTANQLSLINSPLSPSNVVVTDDGILHQNNGDTGSQIPDNGVISRVFGGFMLTAYAAESEGQTLTAQYLTETTPTILKPNVEVGLASYSPTMSSVPGLPFTFGVADTADEALSIRVSVIEGELLRWDITSGKVTRLGENVECKSGETLYWSPIGGETPSTGTIITAEAVEGDAVLGKQEIIITSEKFFYKATVGELQLTFM